MTPIRLIAMDMDGTLLTRIDPVTARIPEENAAVLHGAVRPHGGRRLRG